MTGEVGEVCSPVPAGVRVVGRVLRTGCFAAFVALEPGGEEVAVRVDMSRRAPFRCAVHGRMRVAGCPHVLAVLPLAQGPDRAFSMNRFRLTGDQ